MAVSTDNTGRMCPVDQGQPGERIIAPGTYKTIFTFTINFQYIEFLVDGTEAKNQTVNISVQQLPLRGDNRVRKLVLVGVAPCCHMFHKGLHMIALGREITLDSIVHPATTLRSQIISIEDGTCAD